tara:strand:- start:455 stop:781 length:327 start_codon:yes stop_codon:yes gene_type:complete
MSIDLKSKEGQNKFIQDNMSDLVEGVNESYGPVLLEELIDRLRKTIEEFNNEITSAFDDLKSRENERQKMYDMIKEGTIVKDQNDKDVDSSSDLSDWEIKINEIESQK